MTIHLPHQADNPSEQNITCRASDSFHSWLAKSGGSIALSTYQAGKVALLGFDGQQTTILLRQFTKPMGMAAQGERLVVATKEEVIWLANAPLLAPEYLPERPGSYDSLYLPRVSYSTADLNVHDLAFSKDGLWLVNTRFSCLASLSKDFNFIPRWQPPFISELAPEDRCHLNGLAMVEGMPKYVTVLGTTDSVGGWREDKAKGGAIIDVQTNEIVLQGLSMPHSPRWHDGFLWFLNSGEGQVCRYEPKSKQLEIVCHLPGFLRGLCCVGFYALVGMSQMRERNVFSNLPIADKFERLQCGVAIIDLRQGEIVAELEFTSGVQETYEVLFLAGKQRPMLLNKDKAANQEAVVAPEFAYWLRPQNQIANQV